MSNMIVTSSDAQYFPLLLGLLESIRDHAPPAAPRVCVLDLGLEPAQIEQLISARLADKVIAPGWTDEFPRRELCPQWFQAMVARPRLPRLIPDATMFIWLDAD